MADHYNLDERRTPRRLDSAGSGGDDGGMEARMRQLETDVAVIRSTMATRDHVADETKAITDKIDRQLILLLSIFGGGFALLMGAILGLYAK